MKEWKETAMDHVSGEDFVTYCSSEKKWINRFKRDAEKYPEQVMIKHINDDGSMIVQYPYTWCPMPRPPRKINLTEEQRAERAARLASGRVSQKRTDE